MRYTAGTVQANPVLNSAMQCWQRGTSFAVSTGTYTADRWQGYRSVAGSTISRQTTSDTTNLPNIQYSLRVQRDSGNTSTAAINVAQSLESVNSIPFAGKTITLSFYARSGANYSSASSALGVQIYSGTGTDQNVLTAGYTGSATPVNSTATLTTTWQRFTYTGAIASTATELGLVLFNTPVGTAGANDFFEITGVQIDIGSVALPFRTYAATIQGELAACQRYYQRFGGETAYQTLGSSYNVSTTKTNAIIALPVPMRVIPTSLDSSTLCIQDSNDSISGTLTSVAFANAGNQTIRITGNSTGMTDNLPGALLTSNSTSAYIGFSAEL